MCIWPSLCTYQESIKPKHPVSHTCLKESNCYDAMVSPLVTLVISASQKGRPVSGRVPACLPYMGPAAPVSRWELTSSPVWSTRWRKWGPVWSTLPGNEGSGFPRVCQLTHPDNKGNYILWANWNQPEKGRQDEAIREISFLSSPPRHGGSMSSVWKLSSMTEQLAVLSSKSVVSLVIHHLMISCLTILCTLCGSGIARSTHLSLEAVLWCFLFVLFCFSIPLVFREPKLRYCIILGKTLNLSGSLFTGL